MCALQELAAAQRAAELRRFKVSRAEQQRALDAAKDHLKTLEKMTPADVKKEHKMTRSTALKDIKRTIEAQEVSRSHSTVILAVSVADPVIS